MAENGPKSNFWTTMPGILTGLAALVTAVGGIILGIYQYSGPGSHHGPPQTGPKIEAASPSPAVEEARPTHPPKSDAVPTDNRSPRQPKDAAHIRITKSDGTVMTALAVEAFWFCHHADALELLDGQSVNFDRIVTVDVVSLEKTYKNDYNTKVRIGLINGQYIEGITLCEESEGAFGTNELGDVRVPFLEVKRITFPR